MIWNQLKISRHKNLAIAYTIASASASASADSEMDSNFWQPKPSTQKNLSLKRNFTFFSQKEISFSFFQNYESVFASDVRHKKIWQNFKSSENYFAFNLTSMKYKCKNLLSCSLCCLFDAELFKVEGVKQSKLVNSYGHGPILLKM